MNAHKHMEFIFAGLIAGGCVIAALPDRPAPPVQHEAARAPAMQVVVIKGKRMTALEKRQALAPDAGAHNATAGT